MWIACKLSYEKLDYGIGRDVDDVVWVNEKDIDTSINAGKLTKQLLDIVKSDD